ncbi:MAG: LysR family transcriptional regulator [Proteobacteria bacterium]|nr:LysR family transcriptional regulator [Pseudomonadota bacterium]
MDRIEAMRAFLSVADLGSFTEAARRLRLSAAATSRAVAQLEDELGVNLLRRTTRSVRLTERGELFHRRCRLILDEFEDTARLVRGEDSAPRGGLTVSAPMMFGRMHVAPIVEGLLEAHPALSVRLLLTDRIVHLVDEGVDLAVRIGDLPDSALRAVKVGEVRPVIVASPAYVAGRGAPASPASLGDHQLIAFEGVAATNDWRFGAGGSQVVRIQPRLSVNTAETALLAAEHGLGITRALSYQVADAVADGRLVMLLEAFAADPSPVSLVYRAERTGSANVTAFILAARRRFAEHPLPKAA